MKSHNKLFLALTLILAAVALSAQDKPNFTGTWELNVAKSNLGGAPISKLVVQVDHKDPAFRYTVNGTAGGDDFAETESCTTDGKPATDSHGNQVTAHWGGTTLAFEITGDQGKTLEKVRLSLSSDGKTVTRDYERTAADDPQKRHEIYDKR